MDFVLVLAISLAAGALVPFAPVASVATLAALGTCLRARMTRWVMVGAMAAVAIGAWRAWRVVQVDAARRQADAGPRATCDGLARVTSSPVRVGTTTRATVDLEGSCDGVAWSGALQLYELPDGAVRGDDWTIRARVAPVERFYDDADPRPRLARRAVLRSGRVVDAELASRGRGPPAWVDRARAIVRARITATFSPATEPLARALVLGEADLERSDDAAFRASGLSHLLAVSGMHLVLVVVSFVAVMRRALTFVPPLAARWDVGRVSAASAIPVAWIYADFAGGSGSAMRAFYMLSIALGARAWCRRPDPVRALGGSILAMAIADPLAIFDVSFVLSAAATGGLLAYGASLQSRLERALPSFAQRIVSPAAATTAASIACAPLIALFAPTLPLGGVVANLVAVPLGELAALPLCLAHASLSWAPSLERGCATTASGALALVCRIAHAFADAAWLSVEVPPPTPAQLGAIVIALVAGRLRRWRVVACALAFTIAIEAWLRLDATRAGSLQVTFLDVGQGDSALVRLPDGSAMLVDGGGLVGSPADVGEMVVAPILRSRRRSSLRAVVLSHPHPDHYLGLASGTARVSVGELWDTGQGEREGLDGTHAALVASMRARGVAIRRPRELCGDHVLGGARIEVLAPCPDETPDRGANDNSFVMRITYGQRSVLFMGDAEHTEESELVARARASLRADVLKVGHHGSRTSSRPETLAAIAPAHAVISVGARNGFGHPHAETLENLARVGARVWRTDRDGAVTVTTDGVHLEVRAAAR